MWADLCPLPSPSSGFICPTFTRAWCSIVDISCSPRNTQRSNMMRRNRGRTSCHVNGGHYIPSTVSVCVKDGLVVANRANKCSRRRESRSGSCYRNMIPPWLNLTIPQRRSGRGKSLARTPDLSLYAMKNAVVFFLGCVRSCRSSAVAEQH